MGEPKRAPRIPVTVLVAPGALELIDGMADTEQRTRSQMIRLLLAEAVTARQRRQPK